MRKRRLRRRFLIPSPQKGDRHSDQREESPAHISNFTERLSA
ncbi:hypothetical protein MK137Hg34_000009200 [Viscerimonas tarda]